MPTERHRPPIDCRAQQPAERVEEHEEIQQRAQESAAIFDQQSDHCERAKVDHEKAHSAYEQTLAQSSGHSTSVVDAVVEFIHSGSYGVAQAKRTIRSVMR